MASGSRRRRGFSVVEALDREWRELDFRHPGTVSRWAGRHDALAPCRSFDDILSVARLYSDPVLAALLTEVSLGDQVAGRVVLQGLIGRMVRMAQRDPRATIDDYLARLWCAIGSYPLERRPARIAANLSMDTLKAVSRERRWMGRGDVTLWPSSELLEELLPPAGLDGHRHDSAQPVDTEARRVLEAGVLLGLIDDSAVALLRSVYVDGMPSIEAARRLNTSAGMVRARCSKLVRELATHSPELADAAPGLPATAV
jgi:DNA-directed RNA polymerase specialized sigma24 family protein